MLPEKQMISKLISALFRTKGVIGVDIGSCSVKLSRIVSSSHKIKAIECGVFPLYLPERVTPDEKISIISDEIRSYIKKKGIECRNAVILLSDDEVKISYSRLDRMPEENFKAACRREADKLFFNNENLLIDYDVLGEIYEEGVPKVRVVFAAAQKEVISEKVLIAEKSGLDPLMIIPTPFAYERLLNITDAEKKDDIVFVQLGRKQTGLYKFSGGRAIDVRTVSFGSIRADSEIASVLMTQPKESEEIKTRYPVPVSEDEKFAVLDKFDKEAAASITAKQHYLESITEEIEPLIYLSDVKINKVYISGGPSMDAGICQFLKKRLKLPVEVFPQEQLLAKKSIRLFGKNASLLMPASAASVAMVRNEGSLTSINLLPSGREKQGHTILVAARTILSILIAAMIAALFVINGTNSSLKEAIREKNASRAAAAVQAAAPELESLQKEADSLLPYIGQAEKIKRDRALYARLVRNIADTLPQNVLISSIVIMSGENDNISVDMKVSSKESSAVSKWAEDLSRNAAYSNFTAGKVSKAAEQDSSYVLPVKFDYDGGDSL